MSEGIETVVSDAARGLLGFESPASTRLVFGNGTISSVGEHTKALGGTRVLLVTDPGIVKAGHADRVQQALATAGIGVVVYDQVRENPSTLDVSQCVDVAQAEGIDFLIGLGGGSSMDTAKGCNFLLTNGGEMKDYWGVGKASKPMLPLIAIPTTAGTGSECQSFALIADATTHQKMACGDSKAAARIALLDPELTLSQPRRVTACTGVDAVAHAVESAVTKKRTPISRIYALEAFRLMVEAFPRVLADGKDLEARGSMLLGAALAGVAIENSMLGAAHSAANPLTAHYGVIHGQAVGVMLPHVVAFNAAEPDIQKIYTELAVAGQLVESPSNPEGAVAALVTYLTETLSAADLPTDLGAWNVESDKLPVLAEEASKQWTAGFNPRSITADEFLTLYRSAMP